jgi:ribonuclease E
MSDKEQRPAAGAAPVSPEDRDGDAALSVVSGLMEERRRFESWLASLEARRATTPERVFSRVQADYTARLEAVIAQLTSHTEGLRGELSSLAARLASLQERQQQVREERAEAELRAHVGELSATDWEQVAAAGDARIAALTASHTALQEELRRTRELLADAERPVTSGSSMEAIPAAAPAADVADVAEAALHVPSASEPRVSGADSPAEAPAAPGAEPGTPASDVPVRGRTGSFDELAFLSSVVDSPAGATESAATPSPAPPPSVQPRQAEPGRRDSYALRASDDKIENLDGATGAALVARTGGEKPMAANISGNNPIIIKDKPMEGAKSLKCAECSAMNFPTEWYCERCGAELASL